MNWERLADKSSNRESSTSAVTARSSASKTARPNPSSSNAKTPAASPGPSCSEDNTRRVSQRYVCAYSHPLLPSRELHSPAQTSQSHQPINELTNPLPQQEVAKKRSRRTIKHQRAIVGASLDVIKERRSQRPEAREAARKAAIAAGKEKRTAAQSAKKMEKAKSAANAAKGQTSRIQSKQGAKGAPMKVSAKSR
jgi:hypothetical protein